MLNSRNSSFLQQGERAISKTLSCSCRIFLPPHRVGHAQNNNKHPKDKKKIAQKGNNLFTTAAGVHVPSTGKWWLLETWEYSEGAAELHLQDIKYQLRVERFFIVRCLNRTSGWQLPCPVITIGTKPPLFLTAKTHNSWVQCNFFSAFIRILFWYHLGLWHWSALSSHSKPVAVPFGEALFCPGNPLPEPCSSFLVLPWKATSLSLLRWQPQWNAVQAAEEELQQKTSVCFQGKQIFGVLTGSDKGKRDSAEAKAQTVCLLPLMEG